MRKRRGYKICYLCGDFLDRNIDYDHVPPKQFFAEGIRKKYKLNLLTLPVHQRCNQAFKMDEEYFLHSLAPAATDSYSGAEIWKDIVKRSRKPELQSLHEMVYREFSERPSGLILPEGKILKRFDGKRIWGVAWKIVRGLFYWEKGVFFPENTPRSCFIYLPGDHPDYFIADQPSKGKDPGVFDYRYQTFPKLNNFHFWQMLFWDRLLMQIGFHDPACPCEKCTK